MTPNEVLTLAQAGNPKVLAAIMNRSTRPYGITVKVARKHGCLHVLLEGEAITNSTSLITFVEGSLNKLRVNPDYAVKVYGRQSEDKSVAWSQDIQIQPAHPSTKPLMAESKLVVNPSSASPVINNTPAFPEPQPGESTNLNMALSPPVQEALEQSVSDAGEATPEGPAFLDSSSASSTLESATEKTNVNKRRDDQDVESPDSLQMGENSAHDKVIPSQEGTEAASWGQSSGESLSDDARLDSESIVRADDDIQENAQDVRTEASTAEEASSEEALTEEDISTIEPSLSDSNAVPVTQPANAHLIKQVNDSSDSSMDIPRPPQPEPATEGSELLDENINFDETSDDHEEFDLQLMLKRPEALVIVLFAIALYIWQLYTELIRKAAPDGSVTGQELANRLGVSQSTISRRKLDPDFAAWSASLDPDGIAWVYTSGTFGPQMPDFNNT